MTTKLIFKNANFSANAIPLNNNRYFSASELEQGLWQQNGTINSSETRVSCNTIFNLRDYPKINIPEGYKCILVWFDSSGSPLSGLDYYWNDNSTGEFYVTTLYTSYHNMDSAAKYAVSFAKIDDSSISISDITSDFYLISSEDVPDEYSVDWLQSNGDQKIVLNGVFPDNTYAFETSVKAMNWGWHDKSTSKANCAVFGCGATNNTDVYAMFISNDSTINCMRRGGAVATGMAGELNSQYVLYQSASTYTYNDIDLTVTGTPGDTQATTNPVTLFKNPISDYTGILRMSYFKIWVSDTLTYNLVPILDKYGIPCFKNTLTGQKYYNAGTGNFTTNLHYRDDLKLISTRVTSGLCKSDGTLLHDTYDSRVTSGYIPYSGFTKLTIPEDLKWLVTWFKDTNGTTALANPPSPATVSSAWTETYGNVDLSSAAPKAGTSWDFESCLQAKYFKLSLGKKDNTTLSPSEFNSTYNVVLYSDTRE